MRYSRHLHLRVLAAVGVLAVVCFAWSVGGLLFAHGVNAAQARRPSRAPVELAQTRQPRDFHPRAFTVPRHRAELPIASARVTVSPQLGDIPVPRSFLGLSTEYWELPYLDEHRILFERALDLFHVPGDGRLLLRIGGDSADASVFGSGPLAHRPAWARYELTPLFFRHAGALVRNAHLRLIIDLNTADDDPAAAVQWARSALTGLPVGSVQAFEIGNEPDLFDYWHDRFAEDLALRVPLLMRTGEVTAASYAQIFGAYARALHTTFPTVGIAGPALAAPGRSIAWQIDALKAADGTVSVVTGHRYPLSACIRDPKAAMYPTVHKLLTNQTTTGMARSILPAVRNAHQRGLPYVLTEMNSVTCGGTPRVSNSFATALWAPNALFSLIREGVNEAALHLRVEAINAPFTFHGNRLIARPELYGLAMFARTLGADGQLIGDRIRNGPRANLVAWAVESADRLRVLLTNRASTAVSVDLRLPGHGVAMVQRLIAPSASSRTGETLDGQRIGPDGLLSGRPVFQRADVSAEGLVKVVVPGYSEALLSVPLSHA